uniref:ATP synthase F1 complex delta/epsilon subunit N-terminal domain-containing protein n=1 Tax=Prasinoderma singulare TaxID=676789 RepID=A0A7S3BYI9_9VIRI
MLRRAAASLSRRAAPPARAAYASLADGWAQAAPNLDPPNVATDFMTEMKAPEGTGIPAKLTLNFYLPHGVEFDAAEVDSVTVPAESGDMGVLPGHMPSVARLRPGVLTVNTTDSDVKKYFVSSGYVMVHPTSVTDVTAMEAVPLEQIDADAAKKGLEDAKAALASASDDLAKAEAQVGVEVFTAMAAASN